MKIGTPKEILKGEARVAVTLARHANFKAGYGCLIEKGAAAMF